MNDAQRLLYRKMCAAIVNLCRGRDFRDDEYKAHVATFLRRLHEQSLKALVVEGYDRSRARRRLALAPVPRHPEKTSARRPV